MENLKIVIVGAGMGGLKAALALATDGHEVMVLEGAEVRRSRCSLHQMAAYDIPNLEMARSVQESEYRLIPRD